MAFNKDKDKKLWEGQVGDLKLAICSYDGGEPKLQIGPRVYEKADGSESYRKAGRLSAEEVGEMCKLLQGDAGAILTGEPPE